MSTKYNISGVHTNSKKENQNIFMDSYYNAQFDVEVLASAFNMDKADFMGKLRLIDDFTTFDNERFEVIRAGSDQIEEVTADELALMANVKAVLVDDEWFQFYDNQLKFTETYVASGEYWNYFLNVWKTVSSSPFSNAIAFVTEDASTTLPDTITAEITSKSIGEEGTTITVEIQEDDPALVGTVGEFVQTQAATTAGIAIHKYGAIIFPAGQTSVTLELNVDGTTYTAAAATTTSAEVGDTITFNKQ